MLPIKRIILGIKPLSPENPGGGSFLLFPLLLCSLIQKCICIIDFIVSISLVQGQKSKIMHAQTRTDTQHTHAHMCLFGAPARSARHFADYESL